MYQVSPQEWGARVDYDQWNDRDIQKDKIFVHYNGGNPIAQGGVDVEMARLRSAENWHIDGRGWRGIAYGWAIGSTTGTVFRLRGWNLYGAHLGDIDEDGVRENYEGIPVYFTVGGDQDISPAARRSFADLRTYLEQHEGTPLPVYKHKDTQITSCPGPTLSAWVDSLNGGPMANVTVKMLQHVLNLAGVKDYEGKALVEDDAYGARTESAWKAALQLQSVGELPDHDHPHNHDLSYAKKGHGHTEYSAKGHGHKGKVVESHAVTLTEET